MHRKAFSDLPMHPRDALNHGQLAERMSVPHFGAATYHTIACRSMQGVLTFEQLMDFAREGGLLRATYATRYVMWALIHRSDSTAGGGVKPQHSTHVCCQHCRNR